VLGHAALLSMAGEALAQLQQTPPAQACAVHGPCGSTGVWAWAWERVYKLDCVCQASVRNPSTTMHMACMATAPFGCASKDPAVSGQYNKAPCT
jgi:hypothetical protein